MTHYGWGECYQAARWLLARKAGKMMSNDCESQKICRASSTYHIVTELLPLKCEYEGECPDGPIFSLGETDKPKF